MKEHEHTASHDPAEGQGPATRPRTRAPSIRELEVDDKVLIKPGEKVRAHASPPE
jgi:hypothetical protein